MVKGVPGCDTLWHTRRCRVGYPLQSPETAIDSSEDEVSIDAAMAMRATFALDSPAMRAFFDALVEIPTGSGRKQ